MRESKHSRNIAIGAVAAIPTIGGPLSILLDKYLPSRIVDQYQKFIDAIEKDIMDLHYQIDEKLIQSPEFISLSMKTIDYIVYEYHEEKQAMYRNLILNALINKDAFKIEDYFLYLTSIFSTDQFMYLCELKKLKDEREEGLSLQDLKKMFPQVDEFYLATITTELIRYRLIEGAQISKLGIKFINYINSPIVLFGKSDKECFTNKIPPQFSLNF